MSDFLVAREPQNSRQPKNGVERSAEIKARLDKTEVWTQEREDIDWLCKEVEWLRSAYVVHARKVVEVNPVRTFQDEMLIAKLREQRDKGRAVIALADKLLAAAREFGFRAQAGPGDEQVELDFVNAMEAYKQATDLRKSPQNLNGDQANA